MDHANRFDGKSVSAIASEPAITGNVGLRHRLHGEGVDARSCQDRLVPPLTFDEAAALNTAFLQDVADNVLRAARDADACGSPATPPSVRPAPRIFSSRILPPAIGLIEAWLPNFGDCLLRTIEQIFARGHDSAVVLNSDSPTLPTALLVETAEALARPGDRAVLGPSSDGGYYLLGLKAAHRRMFEDIAWSTERVAEQTLERAREIELDVHRLPVWYDVDDVEGLRRLHARARRPCATARLDKLAPHHAMHTAALMNSLWRDRDFNRRADGFVEAEPMRA